MKKRLLVVVDGSGWVFEKIYRALKKHLVNWDISVFYTASSGNNKETKLIIGQKSREFWSHEENRKKKSEISKKQFEDPEQREIPGFEGITDALDSLTIRK